MARQSPSTKRLRRIRIKRDERRRIASLRRGTEAGQRTELRRDGMPGFGGLSGMFLAEQGCIRGCYVEVIETLGVRSGKVRLPSGRIILVSLSDAA
jgi:hypothetical protein